MSWRDALGELVHRGVHETEKELDTLLGRLRDRIGRRDPIMIQPYRGYGTTHELWLSGRVLEDEGVHEALVEDAPWRNLFAMALRFETDEWPGARVEARREGASTRVTADEEGYFDVRMAVVDGTAAALSWPEVELRLLEDVGRPVRATGRVLVPGTAAEFGVISDVDDTVLPSGATSLRSLARATLLENARTRMPFPGAAAFYQALTRGGGGAQEPRNPLFYVSSSPWNLYDFIEDFFELNGLPPGPLLLRDLGIDEEKFVKGGHDHKLEKIERILSTYPDLPFVLVGDSGQEDPEIYREVAMRCPARIRAIYLRHVGDDARGEQVAALAEELTGRDVDMLLVPNTLAAAEHAAGAGLIDPRRLDDVREDRARERGERRKGGSRPDS